MDTIFIPHSDYLAHSGTKGMRWGQRRYQNYDGSLTPEGRKRYGIGESRETKRAKKQVEKAKAKAAKERAKNNSKKKADIQKAQEEKQKRMEYLRDHPNKIYKYRKELTQDDVDQIMQKVKFDQSLKAIRKNEIDKGMKKINEIKGYADTISNAYVTSKNTWNNVVEVNNALIDMGILKSGRYLRKFGEDDYSFGKHAREKKQREEDEAFEKMLRNEEFEEIYNNRPKYSTSQLSAAYKRKAAADLVKSQIDKDKEAKNKSQSKPKEEKISDAIRDVIRNGSPKEMMKYYGSANQKEKDAIEDAIAKYEETMILATKYMR